MLPAPLMTPGGEGSKSLPEVLQHLQAKGSSKTLGAPESGTLGPSSLALKGQDPRMSKPTPDLHQQFLFDSLWFWSLSFLRKHLYQLVF